MKIVKSIPSELKALMKAIKRAGGNLEEQMNAQKIFKNYFKQAKENN